MLGTLHIFFIVYNIKLFLTKHLQKQLNVNRKTKLPQHVCVSSEKVRGAFSDGDTSPNRNILETIVGVTLKMTQYRTCLIMIENNEITMLDIPIS